MRKDTPIEGTDMSDNNDEQHDSASGTEPSGESAPSFAATADGYVNHVGEVLTRPDEHFADDRHFSRSLGLISIGLCLGLLFVHSLVGQITRFSSWRFEFDFLINAFKSTLAIGLPMLALVFALTWYQKRSSASYSLDFYIARFGALLILPCLLIALAIPLNLIDINLHGWLRGAAVILIYLAVFLMSYWYAAANQLRVAVVFTVGFYFAYRLLLLLF